ncbi:putative small membrane protein [Flavobacterium daejeonense]|nr:putative small membrane protein [Flavobacterium daejeonense]
MENFRIPLFSNTFVENLNRTKMDKKTISTAALLGMIAIILGAFGAHALKKVLNAEQLVTFETGVRYQMYHALFLLFIGLIPVLTSRAKTIIYNLVLLGLLLFSGSIYLLATNELTPFFDFRIIGFITPIGGLLLISAWAVLFYNITKKIS